MSRAKLILRVLFLVVLVLSLAVIPVLADGKGKGKAEAPGQAKAAENASGANKNGRVKGGNSPSVPDDDGHGADKGLPGPDKVEDGGDGDNGSGNDADCEDDNNGKIPPGCKPKPTKTPNPTETPTVTPPESPPNTPVPTPTVTPTPRPPESRRVCVEAVGYATEGFPAGHGGNEELLRGESADRICLDGSIPGRIDWLLWSELLGHDGPRFSVAIAADGPTIELRFENGRLRVLNWDGTFWLDMMFAEAD